MDFQIENSAFDKSRRSNSVTYMFEHGLFKLTLKFIERKEGIRLYGIDVHKAENKFKPKNESALFYAVKNALNELCKAGEFGEHPRFIKRLMWKDGHMTSDFRYYIRTAGKPKKAEKGYKPYYGICDDNYQIADCAEVFRQTGNVYLTCYDLMADED